MPSPLNDINKFREAFDPMKLMSDVEFEKMAEMERLNVGIDCGTSVYFEVKRSIRQDEIVRIAYDPAYDQDVFQNLKEISENYTDCNEGYDFWGTIDGSPWRVILVDNHATWPVVAEEER